MESLSPSLTLFELHRTKKWIMEYLALVRQYQQQLMLMFKKQNDQ